MLKKIFISFLLLIVLGALLIYLFGSRVLGKSIKVGVETFGPKVTQTDVRLDNVNLSILSGDGTVTGLHVSNPKGFSDNDIFALGQIEVATRARSIFSDSIVIDKIRIQQPYINYEKTLKSSNLKELKKNIEESVPSSKDTTDETEETTTTEDTKSSKSVLIKEFIIEEPTVSLNILGVGSTVTLPTIKLENINSASDEVVAEALEKVIAELIESIKSAAMQTTNPKDAAKEALDAVTNPYEEPIEDIKNKINILIGK